MVVRLSSYCKPSLLPILKVEVAMLGNRNCYLVTLSRIVSFSLVALLWLLFCSAVSAGGLDWGDGGDSGDDTACTPDNPLVIVPGPLGSPVRLTRFDEQTYLVADYSEKPSSRSTRLEYQVQLLPR
jgi:hypothetical protein